MFYAYDLVLSLLSLWRTYIQRLLNKNGLTSTKIPTLGLWAIFSVYLSEIKIIRKVCDEISSLCRHIYNAALHHHTAVLLSKHKEFTSNISEKNWYRFILSLYRYFIIKNACNFMESPLVYYMTCINKHPSFFHTEVKPSYRYAHTHHQSSALWVINLTEGLQAKTCMQLESWMLFWVACFNHPLQAQTVEWEPLCPTPHLSL